MIIGVLSGLFLILARVILTFVMHNNILSIDEIENMSSANVLGVVPTNRKSMTSQLIVAARPKSMISEAFRSLRSNLQFVNNDKGSKLLVVTSTISEKERLLSL